MKQLGSSTIPWRLVILLLLVCVVIGVLVSLRSPRPAPFIVLQQPVRMPVALRDRLNRWIPQTRNWAWVWRAEETVFGQRKPVNVNAEIVMLSNSFPATLSGLSLGPADFSHTNGLQVWLLGASQLQALRKRLEQAPKAELSLRTRMNIADGIQSRMFNGQSIALGGLTNEVGWTLGCCARLHPDHTDLTACIGLSELVTNDAAALSGSSLPLSIRTNWDIAIRLQVPSESGLFLFDPNAGDASRKPVGVIIDPLQPKK